MRTVASALSRSMADCRSTLRPRPRPPRRPVPQPRPRPLLRPPRRPVPQPRPRPLLRPPRPVVLVRRRRRGPPRRHRPPLRVRPRPARRQVRRLRLIHRRRKPMELVVRSRVIASRISALTVCAAIRLATGHSSSAPSPGAPAYASKRPLRRRLIDGDWCSASSFSEVWPPSACGAAQSSRVSRRRIWGRPERRWRPTHLAPPVRSPGLCPPMFFEHEHRSLSTSHFRAKPRRSVLPVRSGLELSGSIEKVLVIS
jgi:hypothetical protein